MLKAVSFIWHSLFLFYLCLLLFFLSLPIFLTEVNEMGYFYAIWHVFELISLKRPYLCSVKRKTQE